jgi:hypothetical protein
MDKKLAELTGIILGDGSIGVYSRKDRPGKQYRAKITMNSEKDYRYSEYVSDLFHHAFGQRPHKYFRKNEKTLDLIITKRSVIHKLLGLGLKASPKRNRATIPKRFRRGRLALKVVRGYMDTDGCITVFDNNGSLYPRIEMKICPSPMQKQLIDILRNSGFQPRINDIGEGKKRIMLAGVRKLRKWHRLIGFSNDRNLIIAKKFIRK